MIKLFVTSGVCVFAIGTTYVAADDDGFDRSGDNRVADVFGSAVSAVFPVADCDGSDVQVVPWLDVTVIGLGEVTTDANGDWNAGDGGAGSYPVEADLEGPYVRVTNQGGADGVFIGTATAGTALSVIFDDSNSQRDERNVFDAVNDVHDLIEIVDPGYGYTNQVIEANVSWSSTCGAFWNGSIHFYVAGNGCANTGEIAGVVHHEYGHGIQDDLLGYQGDEGLGEGNADILATLVTRESVIARGFFVGDCTGGIRDADNTAQYPDDLTGSPFDDGLIISGFTWDLFEARTADVGVDTAVIETAALWHLGRKLEAPTVQPEQVISAFIADDDDGDLSNGTPHYDDICAAATLHGFEEYCPEIGEVGVDDPPAGIPLATYLRDARPNPFNPRTTIAYGLDVAETVTLSIYDVNGRLVRTLVDTHQSAGNHAVIWDGRDDTGRDVASGVYYSRLHAGSFAKSSKLNLLK